MRLPQNSGEFAIQAKVLLVVLMVSLVGCQQKSGVNGGAASGTSGDSAATKSAGKKSQESDGAKTMTDCGDLNDWKLVWFDEFDSDKLDTDKWKFETGDGGWGNEEWQNYTAGDNVEISDGTLKIIAKRTGPGQKVGDYTSTRLNSKFDFTYGRVEVRAKMPEYKGNGLWPAIWMLGSSLQHGTGWPECGELDIVEYLSYMPGIVQSAIHTQANNHLDKTQVESGPQELKGCEDEFHAYGVIWTEKRIDFYVDDPANINLTFERPADFNAKNWPFDKPQYLLMNLAVGGWGGTEGVDDSIFPSQLEVDYVRVYQAK